MNVILTNGKQLQSNKTESQKKETKETEKKQDEEEMPREKRIVTVAQLGNNDDQMRATNKKITFLLSFLCFATEEKTESSISKPKRFYNSEVSAPLTYKFQYTIRNEIGFVSFIGKAQITIIK